MAEKNERNLSDIEPVNIDAVLNLSNILLAQDRFNDAYKLLEKALVAHTSNAKISELIDFYNNTLQDSTENLKQKINIKKVSDRLVSAKSYQQSIDVDKLRIMPVLLCYPGAKENCQSPIISENEIFCSPDCATARGPDGFIEIKTSSGLYDIDLILSKIPKHKWPELYVVKPSINNRPFNTSALSCPMVVIIGKDFYDPYQTEILAEYLNNELFDYFLIDTSQVPIELFDLDNEQEPRSLFSILTGCAPDIRKNGTAHSEFISVKKESLKVLSDFILLGERLYSAGKTMDAMKCFTHIITNSRNNDSRCQAYNNIGVLAYNINELNRAEQMFMSALEIDSTNIDAMLNLSDMYLTQGRQDNALDVLNKAIVAYPGNDRISGRFSLITHSTSLEDKFETRKSMEFDRNIISAPTVPEEKRVPIVLASEPLIAKKRKLHIGGKQRVDGWEIINAVNSPEVDHLGNAADLSRFADETFESLYSSHVLEHFDYIELEKVLLEWKRVLIPGGKIYVSVPDLDTIAALLIKRKQSDLEGQFRLMRMIFGGHTDQYDYHYTGLNQTILSYFLQSAGFSDIKKVNNFGIFSDTSLMTFDGVAISLNMTAKKPMD